jgi:hypothetical protein
MKINKNNRGSGSVCSRAQMVIDKRTSLFSNVRGERTRKLLSVIHRVLQINCVPQMVAVKKRIVVYKNQGQGRRSNENVKATISNKKSRL